MIKMLCMAKAISWRCKKGILLGPKLIYPRASANWKNLGWILHDGRVCPEALLDNLDDAMPQWQDCGLSSQNDFA